MEEKQEIKKYKCFGYIPNAVNQNKCIYLGEYNLPEDSKPELQTRKHLFYNLCGLKYKFVKEIQK